MTSCYLYPTYVHPITPQSQPHIKPLLPASPYTVHMGTVVMRRYTTRAARIDAAFYGAVYVGNMSPAARPAALEMVYNSYSDIASAHMPSTQHKLAIQVDEVLATYHCTTPLHKTRCGPHGTAHGGSHQRGAAAANNDNNSSSSSNNSKPANRSGSMCHSADGFELLSGNQDKAISWQQIFDLVKARPGDELTVIVMSRCELGNLDTAIVQGGVFGAPYEGLPASKAQHHRMRALLRTASEIVQALDYLHTHMQVVHGDIKVGLSHVDGIKFLCFTFFLSPLHTCWLQVDAHHEHWGWRGSLFHTSKLIALWCIQGLSCHCLCIPNNGRKWQ